MIRKAAQIRMTPDQRQEQRRSFAYGNTHIENPLITREMIRIQAEAIRDGKRERD